MSSTNVTKLHRHETTWCQRAWTHVLFRSSSSSYIWSMKKITNFFSLSLSLSQKVIMVLIMLELHEPYWVLVCLTPTLLLSKQLCMSFISSYSWSCSCCSHSYYFSKFKVLNVLQAHILVALPRSYYSFKLTFLMFSKLTFLLFFPVAFLLLFLIIFLLLQACVLAIPSSHSYCTFQLCSWVTLFLLLINIPLSILLVTHQHTMNKILLVFHQYTIILEPFHVAFGFFIFLLWVLALWL